MKVKQLEDCVEPLVALGFTETEAAVYAYLVENAPATGYRVAQDLGKPVANTYKAIESLQQKGAVIADETGTKQCRAVPYEEVLESLEASFDRWRSRASEALAGLQPATEDEGVYGLESRDQVLERARSMLARAEETALVDAFPAPLGEVAGAVEEAAARGVTVTCQVYEPVRLEGVEVVTNAHAEEVRGWPGDWLNLVRDGTEMMLAFLAVDGPGVHQAIWSRSPFLCWAYQSALAGEILAARLREGIAAGADRDRLERIIERFAGLRAHESMGYRSLARRFEL